MTTPSKADVLKVAREPVATLRVEMHTHDMGQSLAPNPPFKAAIAHARTIAGTYPLGVYKLYTESQLLAMYAAGIESAKSEGWRQCAVGQHTSQFCGQAEKARAEGAEDMRERAARICETYTDPTRPASCSGYAFWHAKPIRALPITPTNTEGEQG